MLLWKSVDSEERHEIIVEPNKVTFKEQIDIIVSIYNLLLQRNFVLNLISELNFLISLLLTRQYQTSNKESKLTYTNVYTALQSIHNCVYFSVKVLENNLNLLFILDRPSLKMLLDNQNLMKFSKSLLEPIAVIYESKTEKNIEVLNAEADLNVCFSFDTDNRENFPSDSAFHAFRKQRDIFYEILRIWESNHLLSGWNFGVSLGGKIKFLLNLHNDPANFMHFSRLFKAQLLKNCTGNRQDDDAYENQLSFLSSLPGISSEKICLLKNRISTKQFSIDMNTTPNFTGYQEFYKEFITVSNNYSFYCHLRDALISDIMELNELKFTNFELEDSEETWTNCSLKKSYIVYLKSLRMLAKFLGFLESLPYSNETVISNTVLKSQMSIRKQVPTNLDIKNILKTSIENRSLVLTIPWITKYISMLDYVKLRLPQLLEVYDLLFDVHHKCVLETIPSALIKTVSNSKSSKVELLQAKQSLYSIILIKLCLGWLFELRHFPEGLYYEWCYKRLAKCKDVNIMKSNEINGEISLNRSRINIDDLGIVDQHILQLCCPYLGEIRNLLSSNTNLSNSSNKVKHITPVTAPSSPTEMTKKKTQFQLEEAFFNGQPASIRKTVEFVSERVASACVKQICYETVPNFRRKTLEDLKTMLRSSVNREKQKTSLQLLLKNEVEEFTISKFTELEDLIKRTVNKQISDRIPSCIDCLLSFDALPQTKKVCSMISIRMCKERVREWQKSHVVRSIFTKDFDSLVKNILCDNIEKEKREKLTFILPATQKHNESTLSPANLLETIRNFMWDIMEKCEEITSEAVHDLLQSTLETFRERCDVNKAIYHCIIQLMVDLILSLITYRPDLMNKRFFNTEVLHFFKEINCKTDDLFKCIMCPRNVMLMAQSPNIQLAWKVLALFVGLLLKEQLLTCETFEAQTMAMYKHSWDEVVLKMLSDFYHEVVNNFKEFGGEAGKFVYLISFLSNYCANLEDLHLDIGATY